MFLVLQILEMVLLDYNGEASITGGICVALGMSGMSQNFGNNSTQGSMLVNLNSIQKCWDKY